MSRQGCGKSDTADPRYRRDGARIRRQRRRQDAGEPGWERR